MRSSGKIKKNSSEIIFGRRLDKVKIKDWVLRAAAIKSEITIDTENGPISHKEGEGTVIAKGVKHNPKSTERNELDFYDSYLKSL